MKTLAAFIIAGLLSSCASVNRRSPALAGGQPVPVNTDLWRSVIHYSTEHGQCTGVLISRNVMLTAAHCGVVAPRYLVAFLFRGGQPVKEIHASPADMAGTAHPSAQVEFTAHDLAIVKFRAGLLPSEMAPLPIAGSDVSQGQLIYLVGAGRTNAVYDGLGRNPLEIASGTVNDLSADRFSLDLGTANACAGDSGGPGLAYNSSGGYVVVGIHSSMQGNPGQKCGVNPDFARFTTSDLHWLADQLAN